MKARTLSSFLTTVLHSASQVCSAQYSKQLNRLNTYYLTIQQQNPNISGQSFNSFSHFLLKMQVIFDFSLVDYSTFPTKPSSKIDAPEKRTMFTLRPLASSCIFHVVKLAVIKKIPNSLSIQVPSIVRYTINVHIKKKF